MFSHHIHIEIDECDGIIWIAGASHLCCCPLRQQCCQDVLWHGVCFNAINLPNNEYTFQCARSSSISLSPTMQAIDCIANFPGCQKTCHWRDIAESNSACMAVMGMDLVSRLQDVTDTSSVSLGDPKTTLACAGT
jgi:hypothetical protein